MGTDRTQPLPCNPGLTWKAVVAEHRKPRAVATIAPLILVSWSAAVSLSFFLLSLPFDGLALPLPPAPAVLVPCYL